MARAGIAAALAAGMAATGALGTAVAPARADPVGPDRPVCELSRVDRAKASPRLCLSCHDGSVSALAIGWMNMPGSSFGHPVGVSYLDALARDPAGYAGTLPPEVPLVDGKVACTTCHDGAARNPARVVELPGGANLCLACHRK